MADREAIGREIKNARKVLKLTQRQLSERCGVHPVNISEIENGRFTGSFDYFERVLEALDLQFEVVTKTRSLPRWDDIHPEED